MEKFLFPIFLNSVRKKNANYAINKGFAGELLESGESFLPVRLLERFSTEFSKLPPSIFSPGEIFPSLVTGW